MAIGITATSWLYVLYLHSNNGADSNSPTSLETVLLLNSGASISILNTPIFMMITQMAHVCDPNQHDTSKTLTIANQSEVPIKHNNSVTCFSSIETKSSSFVIPFAVVDINILSSERPSSRKTYKFSLSKVLP